YEGASTAGIISALEPVTTIVLGALLLNEAMSIAQYLGGALMICGVVLTEKYG
ncbi:MAG: EamA family transporter, partial [Clostridia bacterium]|nr:EamA family transporter [Clostridia bacterium]